jgi:hypothetical protein
VIVGSTGRTSDIFHDLLYVVLTESPRVSEEGRLVGPSSAETLTPYLDRTSWNSG